MPAGDALPADAPALRYMEVLPDLLWSSQLALASRNRPRLIKVIPGLLRTLLATPGRIWARDELLDRLYLDHRVVVDRTVDSHVRNLRRKLADAGMEGEPIRSVYGMGYSFEP